MYQILSPDNCPIERDKTYKSIRAAKIAFNKWVKRYTTQGYYSSNSGKIDLRDIEYYCTLVEL